MKDIYENPLCERYAGKEMQRIFSQNNKLSYWRKLWLSLAENEQKLGLDITDEQLDEMRAHIYDIDYERANSYERELRHDVMAHIKTFGDACPKSAPIIHLGATSCFVDDNGDILVFREALNEVKERLISTLSSLYDFIIKYKDIPTLGFTHFQPAQPTTIGKRASLWAQDLIFDLEQIEHVIDMLPFAGCKGATGTMASFLTLFNGDKEKALRLERMIADDFGFKNVLEVAGQTYTRKLDYYILSALSGIAQSASKFATDIRLLSHMKEFDEPFESKQVGSSAMAYKRNPMRSERICSLARFVISDTMNTATTSATQWLERSLDDSANRRISIPEGFLAIDGILILYNNIILNGTVYPMVAKKHLEEELPFMATENILMLAVKKGGDRQELHERIRQLSVKMAKEAKLEGKSFDLLDAIVNDDHFNLSKKELDELMNIDNFIGLAPYQAEKLAEHIKEILDKHTPVIKTEEIHC